jgi:hypothetical protein
VHFDGFNFARYTLTYGEGGKSLTIIVKQSSKLKL